MDLFQAIVPQQVNNLTIREGTFIENARLFEQERKGAAELEEQARQLTGLNELSRELNQATNETEIYETVARYMPQIIQADRV